MRPRDPAAAGGGARWPQRLLLAFNGCARRRRCSLTAGGLGYVLLEVQRGCPAVAARARCSPRAAEQRRAPQNFLLVGVDSAANLDRGRPGAGRARRRRRAALRHDHGPAGRPRRPSGRRCCRCRATSGCRSPAAGNQRINSAIQTAGPSELIDTIEQYFGIPINHYVQVDFAGFQELVDVVDGVQRLLRRRRPATRAPGSTSRRPGCVTLDGQQALSLRALAPLPVLRGRALAQRPVRRPRAHQPPAGLHHPRAAPGRRARASATRSPSTASSTPGLDTVTVDDLLTADDIIDLGAGLPRASIPDALGTLLAARSTGGQRRRRRRSCASSDERGPADPRPLPRAPTPATLAPGDVRVQVLNGSGRQRARPGRPATALAAAGFGAAGHRARRSASTSPRPSCGTRPGSEAKADLVARYLDAGARARAGRRAARGRRRRRHRRRLRRRADQPRPPDPSHDDHHRPPRRTTDHRRRRRPSSTTSTTVVRLRARRRR